MPTRKGPFIHEWTPSVRNWIVGVFALLVGFALVLGIVTLVEPSVRPGMRDWSEIVRNVGLGVFGVLGGSFGLYIAYLRSVAAKDAADAALQASKTAQEKEDRERELDRENQFTESFSRAIEQLGHQDVSVRLGALHALALLAQQNKREHWPIVSIIASHVRGASDSSFPGARALKHLEIQLCINILGKRMIEHDPQDEVLDLRGSDLREVEFVNSQFCNARFRGSSFAKAQFKSADFSGADFTSCRLDSAGIESSRFREAVFDQAHWHYGRVTGADFSKAKFVTTEISSVNFVGSDFSETYVLFFGSSGLKLKDCIGTKANWSFSQFSGMSIKSSSFVDSNFSHCKIEKSKFSAVNFRESNFSESEVSGADFWNAEFQAAVFEGARFVDCGFYMSDLGAVAHTPEKIEGTRVIPPADDISNY